MTVEVGKQRAADIALPPLQPQVPHIQPALAKTQPRGRAFESNAAVAAAVGVNLRIIRKRIRIDKIAADLRDNMRRRLEPRWLDDLPHVVGHQRLELRRVERAIELVREIGAFNMILAVAVQPTLWRDNFDAVKLDLWATVFKGKLDRAKFDTPNGKPPRLHGARQLRQAPCLGAQPVAGQDLRVLLDPEIAQHRP